MLAQLLAVPIYKISMRILLSRVLFNKRCIIAIRNKANILTVMLFCIQQAGFCCQLPHFRLVGIVPQRKNRMCKLLLCHGIQHITLVFRLVLRLFQQPSAPFCIVRNPCIVSGCNRIAAQQGSSLVQLFKLHISVAVNTRIRRFAPFIGRYKTVNNFLGKICRKIHDVIPHTQPICNALCIFCIGKRTAGVAANRIIWQIVQLHRDTDTIITLLAQDRSCCRTIHTAAHCDQYFFLHLNFPTSTFLQCRPLLSA